MRTAALGLYFFRDPGRLPEAAAQVSRITHQDPRSVAGVIAIAKAAQLLATHDTLDEGVFCGSIADAIRPYDATFADLVEGLPSRLREDKETAIHAIAWAGSSKPEFSRPIITPFVVPTVLAALWAVLHHQSSWSGAVAEAIHLGGDVDTLGAIVGALAGVRLGASAIPAHLSSGVLASERIKNLAIRYYELATLKSVMP
jgi:ADP-ribosyl-[dinitrogen reductase] hydrolase